MSIEIQSPTTINGIDVGALQAIIGAVSADASAATSHWRVRSRWQGGTRSDHFVDGVEIGGQQIERRFRIQIDEPHELCGSNEFANPQEYLLAATNACMMVGYAAVAALMGITLSKLELEISGDIDLRGFLNVDPSATPGYEHLHYKVHISGNGTRQQFEDLHELVKRTSPNYHNISRPVKLTSELIVDFS